MASGQKRFTLMAGILPTHQSNNEPSISNKDAKAGRTRLAGSRPRGDEPVTFECRRTADLAGRLAASPHVRSVSWPVRIRGLKEARRHGVCTCRRAFVPPSATHERGALGLGSPRFRDQNISALDQFPTFRGRNVRRIRLAEKLDQTLDDERPHEDTSWGATSRPMAFRSSQDWSKFVSSIITHLYSRTSDILVTAVGGHEKLGERIDWRAWTDLPRALRAVINL